MQTISKGDRMLCAILFHGEPTGRQVPVTVLETRRDHVTQEVQSVRVKAKDGPRTRFLWVQANLLTAKEVA